MRTVLFLYLNSLGLICELALVPTPTRQPFATDCKLSKAGHEYAGPLSVTRSGRTCQRWNSDKPHSHSFRNSTLFPEGNADAAGNRCRNPDWRHNEGVWCYTTDPDERWEACDVKFCDCKLTKAGHEYAGPRNVTQSGLACQRWNSDVPHSHEFTESAYFPERSDDVVGNRCRNPDYDHDDGVWCYTTDPNTRWEKCDVQFCDCQLLGDLSGVRYQGKTNQTKSGRQCSFWDSQTLEPHPFNDTRFYPDASVANAGNYCRNPNASRPDGPWCFTNDSYVEWEYCLIPVCSHFHTLEQPKIIYPDVDYELYDVDYDFEHVPRQLYFTPFVSDCKLTRVGREYAGPLSVTRSGRTCQPWISDKPHIHSLQNSTLFPEGSAQGADNKCRNPDNHGEGVWCYTTDPDKRWEECDVEFCDCKPTKAGHDYAGPLDVTRSGLTCQAWTSDQPHSHRFKAPTLFPDGSALAAGNKCRNPDTNHRGGVWCYTTNPAKRWEECDVKLCVFSASTQTRPSSQGPIQPSVDTRITPTSTESKATSPSPMHHSQDKLASHDIVKIVLPTVGVIAVICAIVATIVWKRVACGRKSPAGAEMDPQRAASSPEEIFKENGCFENPMYLEDQQLM